MFGGMRCLAQRSFPYISTIRAQFLPHCLLGNRFHLDEIGGTRDIHSRPAGYDHPISRAHQPLASSRPIPAPIIPSVSYAGSARTGVTPQVMDSRRSTRVSGDVPMMGTVGR